MGGGSCNRVTCMATTATEPLAWASDVATEIVSSHVSHSLTAEALHPILAEQSRYAADAVLARLPRHAEFSTSGGGGLPHTGGLGSATAAGTHAPGLPRQMHHHHVPPPSSYSPTARIRHFPPADGVYVIQLCAHFCVVTNTCWLQCVSSLGSNLQLLILTQVGSDEPMEQDLFSPA